MRRLLFAASLALTTFTVGPAYAQSSRVATPPAQSGGMRLAPATGAAVQVVDGFMAALAGGQFEAARQFMTPDATVMANGHVLGDRDRYIDGAAKGDSAALRSVIQRELLHRDAKATSDSGLVVSDKRLRAAAGAQGPKELVVTETMVLAKTATGWKITHIHWSSRPAG